MIAKLITGVLSTLLLMVCPVVAESMAPMEVIKAPIDTVISILNDSKYKMDDTRSNQRAEIWKTVKPMFDFDQISKRAVARNWKRFTDAEKTSFSHVFSQFLGNTYIDKLQGEYHNEQIVYIGQNFHSDVYAEVRTQIVRETVEIPVNYRMRKDRDGQWKVYDIIVEGVSLVKNYRTQFSSILKKEKPAQLIERLNKKLAQQNKRLSENG